MGSAVPGDKDIAGALELTSPAQELGEGGGGELGTRTAQRSERGEDGEILVQVDVAKLAAAAAVPAKDRPSEALGRFLDEEEAELEGLGEPDVLELRGG